MDDVRTRDRVVGRVKGKTAVEAWLEQAHAHGSLRGYAQWLDEPGHKDAAYLGFPEQVGLAVGALLAHEPEAIRTGTVVDAMEDTHFRISLAVALELGIADRTRALATRAVTLSDEQGIASQRMSVGRQPAKPAPLDGRSIPQRASGRAKGPLTPTSPASSNGTAPVPITR